MSQGDRSSGVSQRWPPVEPPDGIPLAVDFDGTVSLADTLAWLRSRAAQAGGAVEQRRRAARASSKQAEKVYLWEQVGISLDQIPMDDELVEDLRGLRAAGRRLVLVTGSAQTMADAVLQRLGCFDEAIGSTLDVNLTGPRKAAALVKLYGRQGFDYLGDSLADVPVWEAARRRYAVWRPTTPQFDLPPGVIRIDRRTSMVAPPGSAQIWAVDDNWAGLDPAGRPLSRP